MKPLISVLVIACIASLAWDAWLQIKINGLKAGNQSTSALPSELKLRNLQIVDEDGKTVINVTGSKGVGTFFVTGVIGVNANAAGESQAIAMLTNDRFEFAEVKTNNPNGSEIPITVLQNDKGMGRLHLLENGQEKTSFDAFAEGLGFTDSKSAKRTAITAGTLIFADPANKTGSSLDARGIELDAISDDTTKPSTPIAALENNAGTAKLHLYDASLPGISLTALSTNIFSFDSGKGIANWEIPMADANAAFIDVNSKAFGTVRSSEGTFLISCQGVDPYLEGYKVHLQVGNPTTLMINNPTLTVEWGPAFPATSTDKGAWANWKKSLHTTTTTLSESLRPGFWNNVDVVVSPAKADELAHFKVTMQTDSVSLTRPSEQH